VVSFLSLCKILYIYTYIHTYIYVYIYMYGKAETTGTNECMLPLEIGYQRFEIRQKLTSQIFSVLYHRGVVDHSVC